MTETDQPRLDLWRAERSAENVEKALRSKCVPALQRAVIAMMLTHPHARVSDGMRHLQISLREAANWISQNVGCVAGLVCDHTGVRKALQSWIDRSAMQAVDSRSGRVLWLSIERLRDWHDAQPDDDEPPLFAAPQVLTGVDSVLTTVDRCRPLLTGVDSQKNDRVNEENSSLGQQRKTPQSFTHSSARRESPAVNSGQQRSPVQEIVASLPPLPETVWSPSRTPESLRDELAKWYAANEINARCGDHWDDVKSMIAGLILEARKKNTPARYYATCVRGVVLDWIVLEGKAWRRKFAKVPT